MKANEIEPGMSVFVWTERTTPPFRGEVQSVEVESVTRAYIRLAGKLPHQIEGSFSSLAVLTRFKSHGVPYEYATTGEEAIREQVKVCQQRRLQAEHDLDYWKEKEAEARQALKEMK